MELLFFTLIGSFIFSYLFVTALIKIDKNSGKTLGKQNDLKTIAKIKEIEFMRSFLDDRNS